MFAYAFSVMASFTAPEEIGTNVQSLLLLLPLLAAVSVVYKATKLSKITAITFLKESVLLFGSIVVFMVATALVLCVVAWLVTG